MVLNRLVFKSSIGNSLNRKSEIILVFQIGNRQSTIGNFLVDANRLKSRTKAFSLEVLKFIEFLPNNTRGRAVGNQLVRSGTSVGANYRAVCRSRSKAEFIARIGVVEEEADESAFWLELILESDLVPKDKAEPILKEANELVAIMAASRKSAKNGK